jgi:hypothetical protein
MSRVSRAYNPRVNPEPSQLLASPLPAVGDVIEGAALASWGQLGAFSSVGTAVPGRQPRGAEAFWTRTHSGHVYASPHKLDGRISGQQSLN